MLKIMWALSFFLLYTENTNTNLQWCYCTTCKGGIPYCKTYSGRCYVENVNNTFYYYGCMGPEFPTNACIPSYKIYHDQSDYSYSRQIGCCKGSSWCNAEPATLAYVQDRLPDTQRENDFAKQSCYCNVCGNNKTCLTDAYCYRDLSLYGSPIYGCVTNPLFCGIIYNRQLGINYYEPPTQCCTNEKWCNFDIGRIQEFHALDVDSELKIRWMRFERMGYFGSFSIYGIIVRNRIGGKIVANFKRFDGHHEQSTEVNNTDGGFAFRAEYNVLYEFQLIPYISDYLIESIRVFYYAIIYKTKVTWFDSANINLNTSVRSVIICDRCMSSNDSYNCLSCNSYNELGLNPIILPEWS